MLGLKKSTYYRKKKIQKQDELTKFIKQSYMPGFSYNKKKEKVNDILIQKYITEIIADEFGQHYGYKKVTAVLKRKYSLIINKKKVYRLMKVMNVLKDRTERVRKYKKICRNHKVSSSNQLWEMDTKYIFIAGTREVAYLTSIIDVFDRSIIAHDLSLSPDTLAAKRVTIMALYNRKIKNCVNWLTLRTDNGSQFISHKFEELCIKENIIHERIPVRSPNHNAHIESYHRYLQDECLTGKMFVTFKEAENTIERYVNGYNTKRVHSAIDYRTPEEFYNLKNCNFK
uniref:IS3 family transposase n=1 Tax=Clostridium tertium TaxID=1559 RepID=UPI003BAA8358